MRDKCLCVWLLKSSRNNLSIYIYIYTLEPDDDEDDDNDGSGGDSEDGHDSMTFRTKLTPPNTVAN